MRLLPSEIEDPADDGAWPPAVAKTLRQASNVLALPCHMPEALQHCRDNPLLVEVSDMTSAIPLLWNRAKPVRGLRHPVRVWSIGNDAELDRCLAEIHEATSKRELRWFQRNGRSCDPGDDGAFLFAASRDGSRAEGILIGRRWTSVGMDGENLVGAYFVTVDFIFVTPKARRRRLATSMTTVLCNGVGDDMRQLAKNIVRCDLDILVTPHIRGEVITTGGLRMFEAVAFHMGPRYEPPSGVGSDFSFCEVEDDFD